MKAHQKNPRAFSTLDFVFLGVGILVFIIIVIGIIIGVLICYKKRVKRRMNRVVHIETIEPVHTEGPCMVYNQSEA